MDMRPIEERRMVRGRMLAVTCGAAACDHAVEMGKREGLKTGLTRALKMGRFYSSSTNSRVINYLKKEVAKLEEPCHPRR